MSDQVKKLVPTMGLVGIVVFGLSYMAPGIVISTFGVIAVLSSGASPLAYVLATLAMFLTALSYAKLSRIYPSSGSIYTYARKTIGSKLGFLAGWVILLDYLFLPMVAWLITGLYFSAQFPILPSWAWGILVIAFCTAVNVIGLKLADRVNKVLLAIVLVAIVVVIGFALAFAGGSGNSAAAAIWPEGATITAIAAGAAVAAYSFLGFDAVSTLSEEVKNPVRNVPRGIIAVVLAGGFIFILTSFVMQWAHPGVEFENVDTGGYEVLELLGGPVFAGIINSATLLGSLASCVAVQASGSRLLFVMGRDGVLPRKLFGLLLERFRTPVFNLFFIAGIGLIGLFLTVGEAASLINFGAFLAFTVANVCVIVVWYRRRAEMSLKSSLFGFIIVPILGAAIDLYLLSNLSPLALMLGGGWLIVGVIYLAVLTRGFRVPPPGLNFNEGELTDAVDEAPTEVR